MNNGFAAVYTNDNNRFEKATCCVYANGAWYIAKPYVYSNNTWQLAGASGEIMIPYITSDSKQFNDSNAKKYMVKRDGE